MKINGLNHVNILTVDMERSVRFYTALGFRVGPRPTAFPDPGVWLYIADVPLVHLNHAPAMIHQRRIGTTVPAVDHFGFSICGNIDHTAETLRELGIEYDLWDPIPGANRALYFIGPSGERIEFVFVDHFVPVMA